MAATGYTPISLYYSTTASAVPTAGNLVAGELAININDGKLYFKNSSNVVTLLAQSSAASPVTTISFGSTGLTPSTATSGAITVAGTLATTNGGTGLTSFTANRVFYASSTSAIGSSANLTFDGTTLSAAGLSDSGNLTFTGTGNRITGDFSNATVASRVLFQSSTTNGATTVGLIPNGTGTSCAWNAYNGTDTANAGVGAFIINTNELRIQSNAVGTGSFVPITMYTGGSERLRIDTSGNVGIGTNSPASLLHISGGALRGSNAADTLQLIGGVSGTANNIQVRGASHPSTPNIVTFDTNSAERMRIDSAGNVGIGTNAPTAQLQVAGNSSTSALKVPNIEEVATVSATAATGTINYDITTQSVLYYTSNASANWTVNFRGSSGTSLNTLMQTGESISVSFLVTQGSTAYYNSSVQVDGTTSGVTTKWQGSAPTSGNANSIDSYTYVIIKTGSATFTVFATQTKFA